MKKNNKSSGIRQKTHDGIDKIMDKTESLNERGKEAVHHLKDKTIMMRANVDSQIKKNPEKSILIATAIGTLIGIMFATLMIKRKH